MILELRINSILLIQIICHTIKYDNTKHAKCQYMTNCHLLALYYIYNNIRYNMSIYCLSESYRHTIN